MITVELFEKKLGKSSRAKQAFRLLLEEGCDRKGLIEAIFQSSLGQSSAERQVSLKVGAETLSRWKRVADDLRAVATSVDGTIKEFARNRVAEFFFTEKTNPADAMIAFADNLDVLCRNLALATNARSGINESLVFLCYCVKEATGKEYYPEIASLLAVFEGQFYMSKTELKNAAEAIRKRVARFEAQWTVIRDEAREEVAAWDNRKKNSGTTQPKSAT
jgi:hypothetical protein